MSRGFDACCLECRSIRRVRRFELLRRCRPRCLKCGGALELPESLNSSLADVQAKKGSRQKLKEEPTRRVIPHRPMDRHEWWEHPDLYRWTLKDPQVSDRNKEAVKIVGPIKFYEQKTASEVMAGFKHDENGANLMASNLVGEAELRLYRSGKPYYKVWPSIAEALRHTEMRVTGEHFHLPYDGFECRFSKRDNPLEPCSACCVAKVDGDYWTDDRDWSLVMVWFDNVKEFWEKDHVGHYWIADMPIRRNQLLEDSLNQTQLMKQCPNPQLARQIMRVVCGVAFFGLDNHEMVLPDLPRRVIERFQQQGRQLTKTETEKELKAARDAGLFGFKVGSEIDLPTARVNHQSSSLDGQHRELSYGHIRRGLLRRQPCGPKSQDRKTIFVFPTHIRPDLPLQTRHGYRVRATGAKEIVVGD